MGDVTTYKWRDKRLTDNRNEAPIEYLMINMGEDELQIAYNHCKHMLYNPDYKSPGRMLVLDEIAKQLEYCGAELALRWFKQLTDSQGNLLYSEGNLMTDIRSWLASIPNFDPDKVYRLQDFVDVPPEYKSISITALQNACRDNLGYFAHSKISLAFIFRMGLYFKPQELEEFDSYTLGHTLQEKFDILKYQLGLKDSVELKPSPSGLTEQEFRDMIHLKKLKGFSRCKYSEMSTSQLETLRKKVLYAFEEEILYQISVWKELMRQIEEVVEYKHYKLD